MGTVLFYAVLILCFNLLVDLIQIWLNHGVAMHKPAKELLKDHMSPTRKKSYWGLYCFLLIAALCWLVPFFSSHNIQETNLAKGAQAPSLEHWFGTDDLGRDLFIRTLAGGQVSIGVGLAATLVALMIGLPYGLIAGYYAGRIDSLMMRFVDVLYALPFTIIVILLTTLLGEASRSCSSQSVLSNG